MVLRKRAYRNERFTTSFGNTRHSGFSLIEVLVAATVFSLGLAGFAALLLSNLIGSAQARYEGIASMTAASLAEQIRLNPKATERYLQPPEYIEKMCIGQNLCTPQQQADYDFRFWQIELSERLNNARGVVCRDGTPDDGEAGNIECDGTGPLVIKIFWQGQPSQSRSESGKHRYVLPVS